VITCKGKTEILKMERAARIVHEALAECVAACRPGVTTEEIDRIAAQGIASRGGKAAFPGYRGYPKTICISINDEVVHGIPSATRVVKAGDVVGLDLGAIVEGYYADAARSVAVGPVTEAVKVLVETTHAALLAGIEAVRVGGRIGDIGAAVEAVAKQRKYGVVREFVGHGVGRQMHEDPQIPNYRQGKRGPQLKPGMTLALEPMVNEGVADTRVLRDKWTVVTKDGKLSAHFEHTVAITDGEPGILTLL